MRQMTQLLAVAILLIPLTTAVNAQQENAVQPPNHSVLKPPQEDGVTDNQASPSDNAQTNAPSVADVQPSLTTPPTTMASNCCDCCHQVVCCCKPLPRCVKTELCITDCNGCPHEICVKIPRCCCNVQPCITWRDGILGRQVACITWECCDYQVEAIVNRFGRAWVRY